MNDNNSIRERSIRFARQAIENYSSKMSDEIREYIYLYAGRGSFRLYYLKDFDNCLSALEGLIKIICEKILSKQRIGSVHIPY